ncbi:MAG TPA: DegT/DnrJ/EryC1/StrS aminotransferase family protein [Dongiaceae bacterium]|nr:DegT/DnrJ/EryC1/StrS aminotransferase family protein [Dongiaceae bacterium]
MKRAGGDRRRRTAGPSTRRFIPFYRPFTDERDVREVAGSIRSGWLTTGPKVRALEERIAQRVGARHGVAVNSCTAALHLALAALGIGPGDEVVTSPYTFAATGEAILYLGARPVLADIDARTLNLDPEAAARAITRRTRALVPVHIAGLPCDLKALRALARRVPIVEDAAHAIGASIGRRPIGAISEMTCFSFYATKNLTTGEGGMVTLDDRRLADRLRRLSLHGLTRDAWKRYTRAGTWRYDVVELGFKYNMTDVAAAIGLAQLSRFDRMQRRRLRIAERYHRRLAGEEAFELPATVRGMTHAWHLYVLRLAPEVLRIGRDELIEILRDRGVGTSVHFQPLHLHSYYRRTFGYRPGDFPVTERESARALSLPLYPGLSDGDVDRIADTLLEIARRHRR